ncbi:DNA methylase [Trichonephila clavata]|uniref:DNA methylase n=1 Tax=Trichonephila clavata TaxID=2740835 RepID=A0A8X6GQV0_TRICU|nr:DNA methylase [Trichonephila clavata]
MTGFELEKVQRFLDNLDGREEQGEKGEKFSDLAGDDKKVEITKPGDLWILGGHRIYCGDSCLVESFKAVLDDKMADITVCDPPYNVAYGDSQEREDKKILNDDQGEKYELFLYDICSHVLAYTKGAIYICASSSELSTLQKVFEEAGGRWSTFIIWAKNHFTLGRSDYQRQYEAILYGWRSGNKLKKGIVELEDGLIDREQANRAIEAIRDPSQPLRRKGGEIEAKRGNTSELSTMLLKTRIKNEMERGKLLEAKAKAEIGELISVEEVKTEAFNVARVVRNNLLNIPDRVSALLASMNNSEKIHETLTEEIRVALEELTQSIF